MFFQQKYRSLENLNKASEELNIELRAFPEQPANKSTASQCSHKLKADESMSQKQPSVTMSPAALNIVTGIAKQTTPGHTITTSQSNQMSETAVVQSITTINRSNCLPTYCSAATESKCQLRITTSKWFFKFCLPRDLRS